MPEITRTATEVAAMLEDGREIAFLDVREIVPFGSGHPLLATHLALGHIECDIAGLVPRRDTRVIVTDGGEGLSAVAADRLARLGYGNVAVLAGGAPAWAAAGLALFPEIEVPSKGFGDFVARHARPAFITPRELARAIASGEDWVLVDSRPRQEYEVGHIPGSIDAPAGQMLRCFDDLVRNPRTKVAVNCMSRTRGILGGASLVAAGVPNEVYVLWNGTRGWRLEGLALERGATRCAPAPSPHARERARERARNLARLAGLPSIDRGTLEQWRGDSTRTTYVFDVRDRDEYEAGHLAGARNAPEGALAMSPDHYIGTQNARCVLVDDDTVRATIAGLWLSQGGRGRPYVLDDAGLEGALTETGPEPRRFLGFDRARSATITPQALDALIRQSQPLIVDVGNSAAYVLSHVPGARWCLRSALASTLASTAASGSPLVLTSADGVMARLAACDLAESGGEDVLVLDGGTAAWCGAGLTPASGPTELLSPRDDLWLASSERPGDERANVTAYLDWETSLLADIERGGFVPFRNVLWQAPRAAAAEEERA
ncbi:MAG TPA: rhodanese-like domain-containing protein [Candidatus Binatia bacterium]|nr:rhodanese-like domain-containing protein [Candidatus Binatia bacterium]